jgi:hypothetical protein
LAREQLEIWTKGQEEEEEMTEEETALEEESKTKKKKREFEIRKPMENPIPARKCRRRIEEVIPERIRGDATDALGFSPKMTVFETALPGGNSLMYATSDGKKADLADFAVRFGVAAGERMGQNYFAYGSAYFNKRYITENINLVTSYLIFFTQKRKPFLWDANSGWAEFQAKMEKEEQKYKKEWAKISHLSRLVESLKDEGKLPAGWKVVYAKTDADDGWTGDRDQPLGVKRADGSIAWYVSATQLFLALG